VLLRSETNDTGRVVVIAVTATRYNNEGLFDFVMSNSTKLGIALALMFVAIATAPAVLCFSYLAQNAKTHSCCPKDSPPVSVVPTCCVHSPAITSHTADVPATMTIEATVAATDPTRPRFDVEPITVEHQDTSPPGCSSILRI